MDSVESAIRGLMAIFADVYTADEGLYHGLRELNEVKILPVIQGGVNVIHADILLLVKLVVSKDMAHVIAKIACSFPDVVVLYNTNPVDPNRAVMEVLKLHHRHTNPFIQEENLGLHLIMGNATYLKFQDVLTLAPAPVVSLHTLTNFSEMGIPFHPWYLNYKWKNILFAVVIFMQETRFGTLDDHVKRLIVRFF